MIGPAIAPEEGEILIGEAQVLRKIYVLEELRNLVEVARGLIRRVT